MSKIDCYLKAGSSPRLAETISELREHPLVNRIFVGGPGTAQALPAGCEAIESEDPDSTAFFHRLGHTISAEYCLLIQGDRGIRFGPRTLERMYGTASVTGAGWIYADHLDLRREELTRHPVNDYQEGSLRDNFDFGPVILINGRQMKDSMEGMTEPYEYAGLYQLRLALSRNMLPVRIPEFLYTVVHYDGTEMYNAMFDYLDPRNRLVQEEMEHAATTHLRELGAYLEPRFRVPDLHGGSFDAEASVIIPVLNRERTIADAVRSALSQETRFSFNVIVVDNHSTDDTTHILQELASGHGNLIHVIPDRRDLGIGGCWDLAIRHPQCGRFAVQLDSDDLYLDEGSVQQIIDAFYAQECAMVIGSYRLTNFNLEEIPPGLIDHREWTPDNGRNNALRVNGLGAPRAFFTPVIREIGIFNVSYGEDYAAGLAVSRDYRIGRIFNPLYLCRRWEDNSDASLGTEAMNRNDAYKDRIRSFELMARIRKNASG